MRCTIALFALAALSQTAYAAVKSALTAAPLTDIGKTLPVVSLDAVAAQAHKVLSSGRGSSASRVHARFFGAVPPGTFPATLLLCPTADCVSCFPTDLSTFPDNLCLAESFQIASVGVSQPSDQGLPNSLFLGSPGCTDFFAIPQVNACFNTGSNATSPVTDVALN